MKEKNEKKIKKVVDYISITAGTALIALSIYLFLSPNIIAPGGVTGLAVVIKKVLGYKIFITNLVINIPLFLIGVFILGRDSGAKTAFGTLSLSFFLLYFETNFPGVFATNDILLASIFGGVLSGVGIGLVFRSGGTTGGTDLLGAIMNNYIPFISVPKLMMIFDLMVVVIAGVVNRSVETSLYSIITLYLIVKVADFVIEGLDYTKMFYIISAKPEEISAKLINELGRGVTSLKGKGKYTDTDKEVLLCVVYRGQMVKAKEIIYEIDHNAFVMISTTHEVLGEGFRR